MVRELTEKDIKRLINTSGKSSIPEINDLRQIDDLLQRHNKKWIIPSKEDANWLKKESIRMEEEELPKLNSFEKLEFIEIAGWDSLEFEEIHWCYLWFNHVWELLILEWDRDKSSLVSSIDLICLFSVLYPLIPSNLQYPLPFIIEIVYKVKEEKLKEYVIEEIITTPSLLSKILKGDIIPWYYCHAEPYMTVRKKIVERLIRDNRSLLDRVLKIGLENIKFIEKSEENP